VKVQFSPANQRYNGIVNTPTQKEASISNRA